jgi:hypothetical protein
LLLAVVLEVTGAMDIILVRPKTTPVLVAVDLVVALVATLGQVVSAVKVTARTALRVATVLVAMAAAVAAGAVALTGDRAAKVAVSVF